jgi:hypothetical protein
MSASFSIKLLNTFWIIEPETEIDLCAHGNIEVKIGDEIVVDEEGGITISATAFFLLRTLEQEYIPEWRNGMVFSASFLVCGIVNCFHFHENEVHIMGDPYGIDWEIRHERDLVHFKTEKGTTASMKFADYKTQILDFVDKVDAFYAESKPKTLPTDDREKEGYLEFWKEWRQRRALWT